MKKWHRIAALAMLMCLLTGCTTSATESTGSQDVRLFAASVGKGDALLICVDDYTCLIDAGKAYARGKVLAAMRYMGVERLDAVFVTHTDDDHCGGLDWLAQSDIEVDAWYASAMFVEVKEKKHPVVKAAAVRGQGVTWLKSGDQVPLGNTGAMFDVLAPAVLNTEKDDNNSLVMMLETDQGRMLFTGDMELEQEAVLLDGGFDLRCDVLKVANHADDDTTSDVFARTVDAQVAIISTDSYEKPGTPDPGVVARVQATGAQCWVTQDATLGVEVVLTDGTATAAYMNIEAPQAPDILVSEVVAGDDIIVVESKAEVDQDLTGWYLYSEKGEELYAFPDGYVLASGQRVIVGTQSSEKERFDLLWDDKKIIHKSKQDYIILYDDEGRMVSSLSNGY